VNTLDEKTGMMRLEEEFEEEREEREASYRKSMTQQVGEWSSDELYQMKLADLLFC